MLRPVLLAFGFLTRIPVPAPGQHREDDLRRSAWAFPLVGLALGGIIAADLVLLQERPLLAAWSAFALWVMMTGGLHLDGLADVVDGLGAAHGDTERFQNVAKDPHTGGFAVVAVGLALISLLTLLMAIEPQNYWSVFLVPAWARWSAIVSIIAVPPFGSGMAAAMGRSHIVSASLWALILTGLSIWLAPILIVSLAVGLLLPLWWRLKLGGLNGDCLGAGIEVTQIALLLALAAL